MDGSHFDTLVKTLATTPLTRANALRRLVVSAAALAALGRGLAAPDEVTAARSGKCKRAPGPCETCKKGKCEKKDGKKTCKAGKIKPKAIGTLCAGGSCDGSGNCISPTGAVIPPPPQ